MTKAQRSKIAGEAAKACWKKNTSLDYVQQLLAFFSVNECYRDVTPIDPPGRNLAFGGNAELLLIRGRLGSHYNSRSQYAVYLVLGHREVSTRPEPL